MWIMKNIANVINHLEWLTSYDKYNHNTNKSLIFTYKW